jgi:UDP-glucose 4-epimerase
MNVVVTGGAGFIGANLCRCLRNESFVDRLVVIDDLSSGRRENLDAIDGVELRIGSILDAPLLDDAFQAAGAVVHLAARPSVPRSMVNPMASHLVNATGTLEVLEAARRVGKPQVVVASSSSVYGANQSLPKREDNVAMPASPYAASKLAAEAYTLAYGRCFDLPVLAFRFFNVFGPLQSADHEYAAVIPAFVDAALRKKPLPLHGDGCQSRDFTFVDSVTAVLTDSVRRTIVDSEPVNLAFGSRVSLLELIAVLEKVLGRALDRKHLDPRPGDVRDSQADQTKLRNLFPAIQPVALEEGLRATVEWFQTESLREIDS